MRLNTVVAFALAIAGAVTAAPATKPIVPVPVRVLANASIPPCLCTRGTYPLQERICLLVEDSAANTIAYSTPYGIAWQWYFENQFEGYTMLPQWGEFTTSVVPGSINAAGDQLKLTLSSNGTAPCRNIDGFLQCAAGGDETAPIVTFTATWKKDLVGPRSWWYLTAGTGFSLKDADQDNIRNGYLHMFVDQADDRQSVDVYLVTAP